MPKRNVLVWAQAGGIGDTVLALAYGLLEFCGRPFDLVIGTIYNPADAGDAYRRHHEDISRAFTLCRSVVCKTVYVNARVEPLRPDYSLLRFVWEHFGRQADIRFVPFNHPDYNRYGMEHIAAIKEQFRHVFRPQVDRAVAGYLKPDKLNVCFHMRHLRVSSDPAPDTHTSMLTNRNIDTDKWAAFIRAIAEDQELNLIGIGESNPASPHYISPEDVWVLRGRPNISLPFLEPGTSLTDDLFFATACDAMIVNNSGPSMFPIVFDNPLIYLDFEYDTAHLEVSREWTRLLSPHQWRPYGRKSVEQMIRLFTDFRQRELRDIKLPREPSVWAKRVETPSKHDGATTHVDPAKKNSRVRTTRSRSTEKTVLHIQAPDSLMIRNQGLKDRHFGKRCFVIRNGPSLKNANLDVLRGELTIVTDDFWRHPAALTMRPAWYINGHMTHRDINL